MNLPPGLAWQTDPVLLGSLLSVVVIYGLAVGPLRSKLAPGQPFPLQKVLLFLVAVALTYLAEGSPLHDLSERYLFSAHMVQHLLITYICAPLFIWASPDWLLRAFLLNPVIRPLAQVLTKPVVAALLFTLFLSLYHIPALYEAGLKNSSLHHAQHIALMFVSLLVWWPVMSPVKELPSLGYGSQILYLFVTSTVLQLPLFAIITFSDRAFYPTYLNAPRIWFATALEDQQMAGVIMKVLAMVIYSIPIIIIFYKWYYSSKRHPYSRAAS